MDINIPLPEGGLGFVTNNRGVHDEFQFGQQSTIDACLAVGKEWSVSHPHPFSIGQISKKATANAAPSVSQAGRRRDNKNQGQVRLNLVNL